MLDSLDTRHLHITFFIQAVQNQKKTLEAGRPIFEDKEMVEIKFVGDQKKVLVAPANDKFTQDKSTGERISYAQAFHKHYEAFKTGEAKRGEGTPLGSVPGFLESRVAELRALHIHTAEDLAAVSDGNLSRLGMFGRRDRDKVRAYIEAASKGAGAAQLAEENAQLKARLEVLEAAMAAGNKPVAPVEPEEPEELASQFDAWADADLRAFVKDRTGRAPAGQPSHATLVRLAEEANAKEAA